MTATIQTLAQLLRGLGSPVVRAWPQALMPVPSCAFMVQDDSLGEEGDRRVCVQLTLRASSPEQADALAQDADEALLLNGWRRTACQDGAEKDGSCFHKTLRYQRRWAADHDTPLRINNQLLPQADRVVIRYTPALLSVQAVWQGLSSSQLQQILSPTAVPFTLSCHDPRAGAVRGFSARVAACEVKRQQGGWMLTMTINESEE